MNLIVSYTKKQDDYLASEGHKFLGATTLKDIGEVHIFQLFDKDGKVYNSVFVAQAIASEYAALRTKLDNL